VQHRSLLLALALPGIWSPLARAPAPRLHIEDLAAAKKLQQGPGARFFRKLHCSSLHPPPLALEDHRPLALEDHRPLALEDHRPLALEDHRRRP